MEAVGWHYETGTGVAPDSDRALDYYHRAIGAGSWMATLKYAHLLFEQGHHDLWPSVLQGGVDADFIPAFFWLARLRILQSASRTTCRAVRPLFERARTAGHPGAQLILARLMIRGKFGLRDISAGLRLLQQCGTLSSQEYEARQPVSRPA